MKIDTKPLAIGKNSMEIEGSWSQVDQADEIMIAMYSIDANDDMVKSLQAERDATGLLHRDYVATKQPFWLQYNCLPWSAAHNIIRLVADREEFNVRFRSLKTNSYVTLRAYAGANIEYTVLQAFDGAWSEALVSFKLSIIEF